MSLQSDLDHSLLHDDAEIVGPPQRSAAASSSSSASASSSSSSALPHRSSSYIDHLGAAAWTPVPPASPSMPARCCARCAPIQKQLGLVAVDPHDVSRVWARFASLVLLTTAFCFLMLAAAFSRWLNFPGIIALLVLTFCIEAITAVVGIVASKRRPVSLAEPLSPSTTESSLAPAYPRALLVAKWCCTLPLALLCLFFAIWLWMAGAGWISKDTTDITIHSRRQTTTIILLGLNSVVATVAQCFFFLVASSMQQASSADYADEDRSWQEEQLQAVHEAADSSSLVDRNGELEPAAWSRPGL